MRILILASAVGRFGDGATGGVSRYATSMVEALKAASHSVLVLVPEGSTVPPGMKAQQIAGSFQASAAIAERNVHPVPADAALTAMLDWAYSERGNFDCIINLNHDYLPVFATGLFDGKLRHIPNLTSSDAATDQLIAQRFAEHPEHFAAISRFQASKLGLEGAPVLWFGMVAQPAWGTPAADAPIFWSGRITPEKGLEAAAAIAAKAGRKLTVAGHVENPDYFAEVMSQHAGTIDHRGFLGLGELLQLCSEAAATLQTQSWEEALGLTTIEALAAGTPVIAFDRGANGEIIQNGVNGFLIAPGDLDGAAAAISQLDQLDQQAMAVDFQQRFSIGAFQSRLLDWLRHS